VTGLPGFVGEVIFGLGLALAAGNLVALLRPAVLRRRGRKNVQEVASRNRVYVNIAAGLLLMIWGVAILLNQS
jgi:hypothetical protein